MSQSQQPLAGKKLLLINVGSPKKRFILEAMHALGLDIIVLHDERLPWAEKYVSEWMIVKKEESVEHVLESIQTYSKEKAIILNGAITFWEEEIPLLAKICESFHLPGNSFQASLNTRSKFAMQELLKSHGKPAIHQHLLRSESDLDEAIERIGFPSILKPLYGSDSHSVVLANNTKEAKKAYQFVMESFTSPHERMYKYEKGFIVYQQYIAGKEFSVECYCQNGVPNIAGIHEKASMQLPFFVETGDYVPPRIQVKERELLEREAKAALLALKVENSLAHVEIKLMEDGTSHIIEVASRMGGDYTYTSIREVYGFNLVKAGCEIALGIPVSDFVHSPQCALAEQYLFPKKSGIIREMKGFDELSKHPHVVDYFIAAATGERILIPPEGFDSAGWVVVRGKNAAEAEMTLENVIKGLSIETVEG